MQSKNVNSKSGFSEQELEQEVRALLRKARPHLAAEELEVQVQREIVRRTKPPQVATNKPSGERLVSEKERNRAIRLAAKRQNRHLRR